jgi:toxin CcdB
MAQFDIYKNKDPRTKERTPYLMDVQAALLSTLATRVVVPMRASAGSKKPAITRLHPTIRIGNLDYIAVVSEMAAIPTAALGAFVASAQNDRQQIVAATDLVFTGF